MPNIGKNWIISYFLLENSWVAYLHGVFQSMNWKTCSSDDATLSLLFETRKKDQISMTDLSQTTYLWQ